VARSRLALALYAVLPALTLVAGIAVAVVAVAPFVVPDGRVLFALALAAVAPILAAAVLGIVTPRYDVVLLGVIGVLVAIGTSSLFGLSLTPGPAGEFYSAIVTRHALFVAVGFLALVIGSLAERGIDRARRYPFTLLTAAIALTVATVLFGVTVNGARLWLGIGSARFQPSEIARLLIAMFVAVFLYERRHLLAAPWSVRGLDLPPAPYLLPLVGAVIVAVAVLIFQNDLGMAALVVLGASATVVSVVRSRAAVGIAALLLGGALGGAFFAVPRVRDRVLGWLDPWLDPAGRGFQFVQADFSLSAGNFIGDGRAISAGNVPEVHTDLVLVAVASQFGLPVGLAALALAAVLVCRCMLAGLRTRDGFRALLAISLAMLIAIQVILIAGGSLRVLPLTGLTFPLLSYGGTSMIVTQFALGIIVGIGARPAALARRAQFDGVRILHGESAGFPDRGTADAAIWTGAEGRTT
jgi:cell division protein FtsW (lipid II flippase)